jgi:3-hydroxyacyl-CoA dehydrogenase/enoyl-CoA hydratase/3-hydroxybutyryl-CoA epimerase
MNTIDQALMTELAAAIERIRTAPAVRGAVITSGKKAFVAGADLNDVERSYDRMAEDSPAEMLEKYFSLSKLLRRLETCGKPIACAINGTALGGGFEIALACHHRIAADVPDLLIGLPEVQVGLLPGAGGTQRVPRLIGIQAAMPFLLEGKQVGARKALEAGLVHAVAAPQLLLAQAKTWARSSPEATQPWDRKGYRVPGGAGAMDPRVAGAFVVGAAMTHDKTYGNYPAPLAILSLLYEGTQLPFDTALRLEAKYMTRLQMGPAPRSMVRTLFVNKTKCDKLARRPPGVPKTAIARIGVVGAGLMGSGIALVAAQCGLQVVLIDRDQANAEKGLAYGAKRLGDAVAKGRLDAASRDAALARITATADYAGLADAQLVVEAVFEDRELKAAITRRIAQATRSDCVIASNTSTLPITGLAQASPRPQGFIGLHFFSPVDRMPLVEVIRGRKSSDETLARALDLVQVLRKTPIVVNDARGFFTSRFFGAFVSEGLAMVAEGVAPALIENSARMIGMPVGALSVQDEVGIDLAVEVTRTTQKDLGAKFKPGLGFSVVRTLFEDHGRAGRKNGKGFYQYAADGSKRLWPGLAAIYPLRDPQPDAHDVRQRLLYAQLIEAVKCMQEGVLEAPADGDVGSILGVGFPAWTGGPYSYIDGRGAAAVDAECRRLARLYGARFRPPSLLKKMAETGSRFYGAVCV